MVATVAGLRDESGLVRNTHAVDATNLIDVLRLEIGSDEELDVFQLAEVSAGGGPESSS
jgi:hypothetical protein